MRRISAENLLMNQINGLNTTKNTRSGMERAIDVSSGFLMAIIFGASSPKTICATVIKVTQPEPLYGGQLTRLNQG